MAASIAETLRREFGAVIENIDLIPGYGGMHEISVDGELIYSKLKTGRQPVPQQIVDLVRSRLSD